MQARIANPEVTIPDALKAFRGLGNAARQANIPETTLDLVELRASQINGCSVCVDWHSRALKHAGEPDERIYAVAAWRDAPYFTDAERAALALAEAATRIADRNDPVPDDVWDEAAAHYDEAQLAGLVVAIAAINAFNRGNVVTRQVSGDWVDRPVGANPGTEQAA
jgi:AhpD family alkylhydroperoxidase